MGRSKGAQEIEKGRIGGVLLSLLLVVSPLLARSSLAQEGPKPTVEELCRNLEKASEASARKQSVEQLAALGEQARPALAVLSVRLSVEPDAQVQVAIVACLETFIPWAGEGALSPIAMATSGVHASVREAAIRCLGRMGERARPHVVRLLNGLRDSDAAVREAALESFSALGDVAAPYVWNLQYNLKDANPKVASATLRCLVALGSRGQQVLGQSLRMGDAELTKRVFDGLDQAKVDPDAQSRILLGALFDPNVSLRLQLVRRFEGLAKKSPYGLVGLYRAAQDEDLKVRELAEAALATIETEPARVLETLIAMIREPDGNMRYIAIEALRGLGALASEALPVLLEDLKSTELERRRAAAQAFQRLGPVGRSALPDLLEVLNKDADEQVVRSIAWGLAALGPEALPALNSALQSESVVTRRAAAAALLASPDVDPAVLQSLLKASLDADSQVRQAALRALGRHGRGAAAVTKVINDALADPDPNIVRCAVEACDQLGPEVEAFEGLTRAFASPDVGLRQMASRALAGYGRRAAPLLQKALKDPDAWSRRLAAQSLGLLPDAGTEESQALVLAMGDSDPLVRQYAAESLGRIATELEKVLPALTAALQDPAVGVQTAALTAIEAFGPDAAPAAKDLADCLSSPSLQLRRGAARVLGVIGKPAKVAIPGLAKALSDSDSNLRTEAATTLETLADRNDEALAALIQHLEAADDELRPLILDCLRANVLRASAALPILRGWLKDGQRQLAAVETLGEFAADAKPAFVELLGLLKSDSLELRIASVWTIEKIAHPCPELREAALKALEALRETDSEARDAAHTAIENLASKKPGER